MSLHCPIHIQHCLIYSLYVGKHEDHTASPIQPDLQPALPNFTACTPAITKSVQPSLYSLIYYLRCLFYSLYAGNNKNLTASLHCLYSTNHENYTASLLCLYGSNQENHTVSLHCLYSSNHEHHTASLHCVIISLHFLCSSNHENYTASLHCVSQQSRKLHS